MSQEITLIYTKEKIKKSNIPDDQLFFEEKGYTIFPIDIDEYEMEQITIALKKFDSFTELQENSLAFSKNVNLIIDLIRNLNVKTFLLEHFSDFGNVTIGLYFVIVKNDKIFPATNYDSIEEILGYFKSTEDRADIIDIEKYKYYSTCKNLFENGRK